MGSQPRLTIFRSGAWAAIGLLLAALARGAPAPLLTCTIRFAAVQSGENWVLAERPAVVPGIPGKSDPTIGARVGQILSTLPANRFQSGTADSLTTFQFWLYQQYSQNFGAFPAIRTSKAGAINTWEISAPAPKTFSRLVVIVPTTALPPPQPGDPAYLARWREPSSLTDLARECGLDSSATSGATLPPDQATVRNALLASATVEWVPQGSSGAIPRADSPALPLIRRTAATVALAAANDYAAAPGNYRDMIQADLNRSQIGAPYTFTIETNPSSGPFARDSSTLVVVVHGFDPVSVLTVAVDRVDLPDDKGKHRTLAELEKTYGRGPLTQRLESAMRQTQSSLQAYVDRLYPPLSRAGMGSSPAPIVAAQPASAAPGLPVFLDADGRTSLGTRMQDDSLVASHVEIVSPSLQGTPEQLKLPVTYLPSHLALSATINGDSIRELTGNVSAKYSPLGPKGSALSATFVPSTQGIGGGLDYEFPFYLGKAKRFAGTVDAGGNYALTRAVRLGTRDGPLVSLQDVRLGGSVSISREYFFGARAGPPAGSFTLGTSLDARVRDLRGYGPATFLGQPGSLHGLDLTGDLSASLVLGMTQEHPTGLWQLDSDVTFGCWLVDRGPDVSSATASTAVRRFFYSSGAGGGGILSGSYVELRGEAGRVGSVAPRVDFFRLGGDQWLRGMEDGELAGRSYWCVAIEGGPNLATLARLLPTSGTASSGPSAPANGRAAAASSPLNNIYLYGTIEAGAVGGQQDAGTDFNPARSAQSYGVGLRLFGAIPNGTLAVGYARSRQALHPSGRFFVSIFLLQSN